MEFDTFCKELGIEKENTLPRFFYKEDMYIRYCNYFLEDTTFAKIKEVMEQYAIGAEAPTEAMVERLRRLVHTLKGVSASLGFMQLFAIADEVVNLMRADMSAEEKLSQADARYVAMKKEYQRLCQVIGLEQSSADNTAG